MADDSVAERPDSGERTVTATEAAHLIGITADQLRMWSQADAFGPFLAAPRTPSGRRRYTDHDIAVCQLIRRWHEQEGLTYREIAGRFEKLGVDRCLHMAIGAEQTNLVLQEEADRLRQELATLQLEKSHWQDEKVQLQAVATRWQQARAAGLVVTREISAKQGQAEREMEFLEQAQRRAARHLQEAEEALGRLSLWAWLTGGRQRALVHLKEARLAYDETSERVATMRTTLQQIAVGEIQRVLQLPTAKDSDAIDITSHRASDSTTNGTAV